MSQSGARIFKIVVLCVLWMGIATGAVCLPTPPEARYPRPDMDTVPYHPSLSGITRNAKSALALTSGPIPPNQQLKFEHLSLEEGLSQSTVNCIVQDSRGFMWFGTRDGLNKYDGYHFKVYKYDPEDPYSLSHNAVQSLFEDHSGDLWIGTGGGGLNHFDRVTENFIQYRHNPDNPYTLSDDAINVIYEDSRGILWIGTANGGLNRFERKTEQFSTYRYDPDDAYSISDDCITTIFEDHLGILWVGTCSGGLNRFDYETGYFSVFKHFLSDSYSLSNNEILSIYEDHAGILWVGTGYGLNRFSRRAAIFTHYYGDPYTSYALSGNVISEIYADSSGNLWIGTGSNGLNKFDRDHNRFIQYHPDSHNAKSLSSDSITAIYESPGGVLWVGTNGGGINKFDIGDRNFIHYHSVLDDAYSLSSNDVLAIYEDQAGILWVGTRDGGLNKFDPDIGGFVHYQYDPNATESLISVDSRLREEIGDDGAGDLVINIQRSLVGNDVHSIYQDQDGILWIGTNNGLNKFNPRTEQFTVYRHNPYDVQTISAGDVTAITEDTDGNLWVGTYGGGLNEFNRDKEVFTHYRHNNNPDSLSSNAVRVIHCGVSGSLWVATDSGLNQFDPVTGKFIHYVYNPENTNSLSENAVLSVYESPDSILWIGTNGGGLNKFDIQRNQFVHYREKHGLPNDVVYGILEDEQGFLWLSTNKGLAKFNPSTGTFKNYDVRDGLQSNEFNSGAYHKGRSGGLFFGGIRGLTAFRPADVLDNTRQPAVVLTSITQGGEAIPLRTSLESIQGITFAWPNNFFEFEFAALNYVQSEKNQYSYMLENFDKDWIHTGTRRFGKYTNLPGGTYVLKLKASNNDGVWAAEILAIEITVIPPFWETWWFLGGVSISVILGIYIGYRMRVRGIAERNRELESQVTERTYEIQRRRLVAEGLRDILIILNSDSSLEDSLDYIARQASRLMDAKAVLVFRCYGVEHKARVVASSGGALPSLPRSLEVPLFAQQWAGEGILRSEPLVISDLAGYKNTSVQIRGLYRAALGIPLCPGGEIYGGLLLFYAHSQNFTDEDIELGFTFADHAILAIANNQLREQVRQIAVTTERNRLARDLHDAVTQTLFSASLISEALPELWENDQDEGRALLQELRQLSRGALAEMRSLLLELRPSALVEARMEDLLRQLGEAVTGRTGVPVAFVFEGQCDTLPPDVHVALYRIAQEALNNVVKHARAKQVTVSLYCAQLPGDNGAQLRTQIKLDVSDDGRGFDPRCVSADHLGLGIIRERAQAIGATLQLSSQPGEGTQVQVVWEE